MSVYLIPVQAHKAPIADLGLYADCPLCKGTASVNGPEHHTTPGHITDFHFTETGVLCPAAGMALTLEAALARDERMTQQERAVQAAVRRAELACKGYDTITGEPCSHPVCAPRRAARKAAA